MADEPVALDTEIGGATTNSFITLVEADAYIHARPFHDAWDNAQLTDDRKRAALVWATRILSQFGWKGTYVSDTQALPWPRDGVYDLDGRAYSITAYPEWLKVATSELALALITSDRLGDSGTEGFSSIKLGSMTLNVDPKDRASWIPEYIMKAIRPWLNGSGRSSINRPVERA